MKQGGCSAGNSGWVGFDDAFQADSGGVAWTSEDNILGSDNARASCNIGGTAPNFSDYIGTMIVTGGLAIPPSAQITLLEARIELRKTVASGSLAEGKLQWHVGGALKGNATALFSFSIVESVKTHSADSGADPLWGWTPSPSDINDPNLGMSFICQETTADVGFAQIDNIEMKVTWVCP